MNSKIVETLEFMCDKENAQDKKILLLAELVDTRCEELGKNQDDLKECLDYTNSKLDRLTELLEKYETDTHGCPVYKDKDNYAKLSFFLKYPKLFICVVIGSIALLGGFLGTNFSKWIKILFDI